MELNLQENQNIIVGVAVVIVFCCILLMVEFVWGWVRRVWYVVSCECVR